MVRDGVVVTAPHRLHVVRPGDRARELARQRKARYRRRLKEGLTVVPVEVSNGTDLLVETRWLAIERSGDRREIGDAVSRMLEDAAKGR